MCRTSLGTLCTNHRAVWICGLGWSAVLQILAIATAIAASCAWQPLPIRSTHLPLDSCRGSLAVFAPLALHPPLWQPAPPNACGTRTCLSRPPFATFVLSLPRGPPKALGGEVCHSGGCN